MSDPTNTPSEAPVSTPEPIVVTASTETPPESAEPMATVAMSHENNSTSGKKSDDSKLMAVLAYLGVLIIVPLLVAKEKKFVKFHLKQGLVLIVGWALVWAVQMIVIPFNFLAPILWFVLFLLSLVGILNAISGKEKELPILGQYGKYFDELLN